MADTDTDNSQDQDKEAFDRKCSLIIAIIASILVINSMGAQNAAGAANFLNAQAINTYAFYQARTIRQNDVGLAATTLEAIAEAALPAGNGAAREAIRLQAAALREKVVSYESDAQSGEGKKELLAKAREAERARDVAMDRGPYFDFAGLFLQLSIILFSVVLITKRRTLYLSGLIVGAVGTVLSLDGFFMFLRLPFLA